MKNWFQYNTFTRGALGSLIVLAILLALGYFAFCTQAGTLDAVDDGRVVVMAGQVTGCFGDVGAECVYVLEDPSGSVYVVSGLGAPAEGAFILVWGTTSETDEGRRLLIEQKRAGTF